MQAELTTTSSRIDPRVVWVAAALAAGGVAGMLASRPMMAVALAVGTALVVGALWRIEIGLLALLLTLPLDVYGRVLTSPVTVTVFHLVLLVVLAAWYVRLLTEGCAWLRPSTLDLSMAVILLAALWSLPHSLNQGATVFSIVRLLGLWVFCLVYTNGIRNERQLRHVWIVFGVTGAVIGLLAVLQAAIPSLQFGLVTDIQAIGGTLALRRPSVFFKDPNYLGGFLSVCSVAALAMLMHAREKKWALGWLVVALASGLGLIVTFSRSAWVGAAVGLVAAVLMAPKRWRGRLIAIGLVLIIVASAVAPTQVTSRAQSIGDVDNDLSVATRYYMIFSAVDIIQDYWVWGTGLTAFEYAYVDYRRPGTLISVTKPHQLPLSMWAEMGIAGLAAEVILVLLLVLTYWRKRPNGWTPWEAAALAGTITLLPQTLFQYYLYFEYLWLMLALGVVATRFARASEEVVDD